MFGRVRRVSVLSSCFLIFFMATGVAFAAPAHDESYFELGEVVVSHELPVAEAVTSVVRIDAETIKSRGARSLNEALQMVPGLNIRTGADGVPRIDIRGLRTRHVLLLVDGIPLNSTYDGQFDPTIIPVEHIAQIKVTSGSSSVLYGPGGNGGVINIITKKGSEGIHGSVAAEAGEGDAHLGKITVGGASEKADFFISGQASERDGFNLSDDWHATEYEDGSLRENSDRKNRNLFANFGYALSDATQLGITANVLEGEFGKSPVTNFDKNDPFTKSPKYQRVESLEGLSTQVALSHDTSGPLSFRGWVYINRLDEEENRYDDDGYDTQSNKGSFSSESTTESTGANLQVQGDFQGAGVLTLGLMAQEEGWEETGFKMDTDSKTKTKTKAKAKQVSLDEDRDVRIYTSALEYAIAPTDGLGLVLGYGYHYQKREAGIEEDDFSYLAGAHYDLSDKTRFKASHSRKVRFPSMKQLYADGGDEDLTAEVTLNYEVGVEQQLPASTTLSLTGFVMEAEDFIEKDDNGETHNYDKYRFQGFDIVAENRSVENLVVSAAYSYLDSEDCSGGSQKEELQYRPRDKFTVEGCYAFPFGLRAQASVIYVAHQFFYNDDTKAPLEKKRLDDYAVVNVNLSQSFFDESLDLYVRAENLFDENYEQSYGFPQAGRTVSGGVAYRF